MYIRMTYFQLLVLNSVIVRDIPISYHIYMYIIIIEAVYSIGILVDLHTTTIYIYTIVITFTLKGYEPVT